MDHFFIPHSPIVKIGPKSIISEVTKVGDDWFIKNQIFGKYNLHEIYFLSPCVRLVIAGCVSGKSSHLSNYPPKLIQNQKIKDQ
jgi:hypothetical protein